jgi:indolepyruvate ferredoxin oxidoreductase
VQPVDTEFGRKTRIDQSSCNKDYSCLKGDCPSFLTVVPGAGRARPAVPALAADALPAPVDRFGGGRHTTRLMGVGGTGVVTTAQVLTVAATLAGRHVVALDQTGMAQKGGAVVSDIKLDDRPLTGANKAAAGEVDLYLGADLLVAADPKNLATTDPARTVAVVSTTEVPTGQMVADTAQRFPDTAPVLDRIRSATRADAAVFLDARVLSERLFGTDQFANMLLIGVAYQAGALPLPATAIEAAIAENGVLVEANVQAFRRGRQLVADPAALDAVLPGGRRPTPAPLPAATRSLIAAVRAAGGSELARLVAVRVPELVAYQDRAYARRYVELVERVRATEAERVPGETALAESVARHLHKLMAYKDEYEVARLSLEPSVSAAATAQFGPGARVSYRLHPPVLRAMGMHEKITLGPWFRPAFRALVAMRRLRGTAFDPFGRAHVRRVERELVEEYRGVVDDLLRVLSPGNHQLAVRIAALPDRVRGYEGVKLGTVERYRRELGELTAELVGVGV